jgi:hypothetical protein
MKSVKNQFADLQEGKMSQSQFLRNIRLTLPQYVTNVTSFDDSVRILKNKGILTEADTKSSEGEGKWKTVTGKDLYAHFKELDSLNGHEVAQGIDWEMQCHPDLTKNEVIKIVIKNLKKNPIYYTSWDLSGVEGYEPEYMSKSSKLEDWQMKPFGKDNLVDKAMGMKPVKGFENAKASSNKASKETNKGEEVDIMSLVAMKPRGVEKMSATGEKTKKIIMKEGEEMGTMALVQHFINSNPTLRQNISDIKFFDFGKNVILKYKLWDTLPDELYSKLELQFNVNGVNDNDEEGEKIYYTLTPKQSPYKPQYSGTGLQSALKEEIRKIVREMFDGRNNLTDVTGENL